ncbi:translocation/assembly module TamB domain-containing protein [Aquimarina agarivorans]|uniref:translocation/assembly module TamB domain-containing protein n=1 Tax=Aquimarina agarivorans TaxID=980584 RepID=UPI000248FAAD|nr:translocation/assembly module TamB domain-containing protein [Aquimarina agarivorans]
MNKNKNYTLWNKILKIGAYIFGAILVLLLCVILFIRSSSGQNIIVNKTVNFLKEKTQTEIAISKLYVTFGGNILLEDFYVEDRKKDTLVFSEKLEIDVPLLPIITGKSIAINTVDWEGLKANITRKDSINGYNFQFLIDAFVSSESSVKETKKDTTAAPPEISIGDLNFNDFDIIFNDAVLGIDSRFTIGELALNLKKTDIEAMDYRASKLKISNSNIKYTQSPILKKEEASDSISSLPFLSFEAIEFNNIDVHYNSIEDKLNAKIAVSKLQAETPKIDLNNNYFIIDKFKITDSKFLLKTDLVESQTVETETTNTSFEWPKYDIVATNLEIKNTAFSYFVGQAQPKSNAFDPQAVVLTNFNLNIKEANLKEEFAKVKLQNLSFKENSGLNLEQFSTTASITNRQINVGNLKLKLNNNQLFGGAKVSYSSLENFINQPENSNLNLSLNKIQADISEAFKFQPELKQNEYVAKLSKHMVTGKLYVSGKLSDIKVDDTQFSWGTATAINVKGQLRNATEPDKLQYDFPEIEIISSSQDIYNFVPKDSLGLQLPKEIAVTGNLKGTTAQVITNSQIKTTQGNVLIDGTLDITETLKFDAKFSTEEYQLDQLLKNEQLGALSLKIEGSGAGKTINKMDADFTATVDTFSLKKYTIKDLVIKGKLDDGSGMLTSNYKDDYLNLKLKSDVVLDTVNTKAKIDLNVIGADLEALGLFKRNIRTGLKLTADFNGSPEDFKATAEINDGVVVYDNHTYLLGKLAANAFIKNDTTALSVTNKIVDLKLLSNTNPQGFSKAITNHFKSYFTTTSNKIVDTIYTPPVKLKLEGHLSQAPILSEVFLINLKDVDTVGIMLDFNENLNKLKAEVVAPHINYSGSEIDSLALNVNTSNQNLDFDLGFNAITTGPIAIKKTSISGSQNNGKMQLSLLSMHEKEKLIQFDATVNSKKNSTELKVNPQSLIINKHKWRTPTTNKLVFSDNKLTFTDFNFTNNNQKVAFKNDLPNVKKEHIALKFNQFKISEILNYFNPETELAHGTLNGNLVVEHPFTDTGILADLKISKFNVLDVDLGTLTMDASSKDIKTYNFSSELKEGQVNLSVNGNYEANQNGAILNLNLLFDKFNMQALEGFTQGEITNAKGNFSGNFKINGKLSEPQYKGNLNFTNAYFSIAKFNTGFTFVQEKLTASNKGITLNSFTVLDEKKNKLVVSGEIGTKSFSNPTFDLSVKAEDFQVLNAVKKDNDFLYGKAIFGVNTQITGDLDIPIVKGKVTVNPETNVTYILPQSTANIEERDGIVLFVNKENPNAILTQTEQETAKLKGFDIDLKIDVDKYATAKIIIDERTGDNFKISGHGDLNLKMKPNGRISLAGFYDVNKGHYELNLYNLVNRKFEIVPGSRVVWSGNPFDAKLDVKALYNVKASASSLMAAQTSGADPSVKGKFRQVLPFNVYLNIDGQITQPELTFNIDMPEDEQGAIGGQVYGKIQQLNQQESELNKQIFSLLVLNRFYPEPGSDGSGGGAASIATNNLSDAVSDQLNQFSDKLLGDTGFKLDFGLNSYTDYQSATPQDRTQLDIAAQKSLFNDRLTVSVGSEVDLQGSNTNGETTPLIGNVTLEYLLTKNGRYRLKGFRKNEFENVIDGQTIVSGIALIFAQEFNKFDELWDAILRKEKKKASEKDEKDEKESIEEKNANTEKTKQQP